MTPEIRNGLVKIVTEIDGHELPLGILDGIGQVTSKTYFGVALTPPEGREFLKLAPRIYRLLTEETRWNGYSIEEAFMLSPVGGFPKGGVN